MASYRPLKGQTQEALEEQLSLRQQELMSARSLQSMSTDGTQQAYQVRSIENAIAAIRYELWFLDPDKYPREEIQRQTRSQVSFR